eukprot:364521-Chlamydomonas_euryale.AAC.3
MRRSCKTGSVVVPRPAQWRPLQYLSLVPRSLKIVVDRLLVPAPSTGHTRINGPHLLPAVGKSDIGVPGHSQPATATGSWGELGRATPAPAQQCSLR